VRRLRTVSLLLVVLAGTAACAATPTRPPREVFPADPRVEADVLAGARARARAVHSCRVGWERTLGPGEVAAAFLCSVGLGMDQGAVTLGPAGVVQLQLWPLDRRPPFTRVELAGQLPDGQPYLFVLGVVNRSDIDLMTVRYQDGTLGMMQVGDLEPRMYAFVRTGTPSPVQAITAYAHGKPAYVSPPFPPRRV
jgi:hypothetical protein